MAKAEIISIGTELLLGEIVDTNSQFIAKELRDAGIDLFRTVTVGDNVNRIANAVSEAVQTNDIVITTGGLGPTIDDMTREAIAQALDRELVFQDELWDQIQRRFKRFGRKPTRNNRRQAYVPDGAITIENPKGTAPVFIIDDSGFTIMVLPGVPREMKFLFQQRMLPFLQTKYPSNFLIKTRILHTGGVGESQIDEKIADLEKLTNPTVGLAAHLGQVDIRITAKARSDSEAVQKISEVEKELRERLGNWIFGADGETLEKAALSRLKHHNRRIAVLECGLQGQLLNRFASAESSYTDVDEPVLKEGRLITGSMSLERFTSLVENLASRIHVTAVFGVLLSGAADQHTCHTLISTPSKSFQEERRYNGPLPFVIRWALHNSLDFLRRCEDLYDE